MCKSALDFVMEISSNCGWKDMIKLLLNSSSVEQESIILDERSPYFHHQIASSSSNLGEIRKVSAGKAARLQRREEQLPCHHNAADNTHFFERFFFHSLTCTGTPRISQSRHCPYLGTNSKATNFIFLILHLLLVDLIKKTSLIPCFFRPVVLVFQQH